MITVKIGTNSNRKSIIADPNKTPKDLFNQEGIDYSRATAQLDGESLTAANMNKSLAELGIKDSCYLIAVVKTDNSR